MNKIHAELGRKLRLGVVGGGEGSFIGPVHRIAARMSDYYELKATVLSSDPERSVKNGLALGIEENRAYPGWEQMLEEEQKRSDAIDVIAIMTPNDTHFPISYAFLEAGFHVICDKPMCNTREEAKALVEHVKRTQKIFCVTYNYSAYPMVRQARAMVRQGVIGEIRQVYLTYVQGHLATYSPESDNTWRANPARGGASLVLADIATHTFHLGEYVTGEKVGAVMADVGSVIPGRQSDDYVSCLLRFENNARGSLWVTNSAAGAEHGLSFRIFGAKGGLEWHQEKPNELRHRQLNGFEQILTRRMDGLLSPEAEQSSQLRFGHPEGFHDAFANLYREAALAIIAEKSNSLSEKLLTFPNVEDGARGVDFIFKCLESRAKNTWVEWV